VVVCAGLTLFLYYRFFFIFYIFVCDDSVQVILVLLFTSQRLRPTIHEIITSKIKAHADLLNSSRSSIGKGSRTGTGDLHFIKGQLESYQLPKQKHKNGISIAGTLLAVSPVSPLMAPGGKAQVAAKDLLDSILDAVVRIFGEPQ